VVADDIRPNFFIAITNQMILKHSKLCDLIMEAMFQLMHKYLVIDGIGNCWSILQVVGVFSVSSKSITEAGQLLQSWMYY